MKDRKLQQFLSEIRRELGIEKVAIRSSNYPGDPSIPWFIYLLGIQSEKLSETSDAAWDIAFGIYGTVHIPFFLSAVTAETAREFFPDEFKQSA